MLYTALPGETLKALFWFVVGNIAFEMGSVFYNAFLPDIASQDKIGRVSGYGWSLGYVGGLLAMFIAMIGFVSPETPWFGFSKEQGENIRATNILVAVWFAIFSLPIFLFVKEDKSKIAKEGEKIISSSFRQLSQTFQEMRKYSQIIRFLIARLVYNDGLITIFAFGGIYAAGTFNFSFQEIMIFGIVLNITAGIGAFIFGFFDDKWGGKKTVQVSNICLAIAVIVAVFAPDKLWLWIAGIVVGIFSGPNQAASRSLMGRFVPPEKENEFFGFFAFSGKFTAFLGPLLLGILTEMFNSQRAGISAVFFFFVIGGLILHTVKEEEGIKTAGRN
jgi:UMF1 family MFS transporter